MADIDLDELERLLREATQGEWWVVEPSDSPLMPEDWNVVIGEQEDRVCECHDGECKPEQNARLIVAMHAALPWLISRARRAEELQHAIAALSMDISLSMERGEAVDGKAVCSKLNAMFHGDRVTESLKGEPSP